MITIEHDESRLCASVFGEFTLSDFKEFEDQVNYRLEFKGRVNLLLDLTKMAKYTIDMVWEEIKYGKAHPYAFGKIAVLTDSEWVGSLAWLSNMFTDAEIRVYHDPHQAEEWLSN